MTSLVYREREREGRGGERGRGGGRGGKGGREHKGEIGEREGKKRKLHP